MTLATVDSVTYPDPTGPFVLDRSDGKWRVTHHNVEDAEPTVFGFDHVLDATGFLDGCGVSRTI